MQICALCNAIWLFEYRIIENDKTVPSSIDSGVARPIGVTPLTQGKFAPIRWNCAAIIYQKLYFLFKYFHNQWTHVTILLPFLIFDFDSRDPQGLRNDGQGSYIRKDQIMSVWKTYLNFSLWYPMMMMWALFSFLYHLRLNTYTVQVWKIIQTDYNKCPKKHRHRAVQNDEHFDVSRQQNHSFEYDSFEYDPRPYVKWASIIDRADSSFNTTVKNRSKFKCHNMYVS